MELSTKLLLFSPKYKCYGDFLGRGGIAVFLGITESRMKIVLQSFAFINIPLAPEGYMLIS